MSGNPLPACFSKARLNRKGSRAFYRQTGDKMQPTKVVVRYADGRVIKGYTEDFLPTKPSFLVRPTNGGTAIDSVEVLVRDLKAVFFVRDFMGNPNHMDRKDFSDGVDAPGLLLQVTFKDGEVIVGSTLDYDPQRPGFFILPADSNGNNLGIFVVSHSGIQVIHL
jgi:hypothetical protein